MTTIPTGTTKRQLNTEWADLLDVPSREARERTELEELRLTELTALLYTADNESNGLTPLHVEAMQARFTELEAALDETIAPERANEIMLELVDLQAAIEKEHGRFDDMGEWAMRQKRGEAL